MLYPTVWNLRLLDRYATTGELISSMSAMGAFPTIRAQLVEDEYGERRIFVPVDPEDLGVPEG